MHFQVKIDEPNVSQQYGCMRDRKQLQHMAIKAYTIATPRAVLDSGAGAGATLHATHPIRPKMEHVH